MMDYMQEVDRNNSHFIKSSRSNRKAQPHLDMTEEELFSVAETAMRYEEARKRLHDVADFRRMNMKLGFSVAKLVRPLLYLVESLKDEQRRLQAVNRRLTIETEAMTSAIQRHRDQADGMASRIKELETLYDETTGDSGHFKSEYLV